MTKPELISWKTDAWKNPEMVAWYHQRMIEDQGTNQLKNQVELDLCQRFVIGPKILDVGVGTGRGSLPLARAGYEVTGVDSSQAMLDQTRRLAGSVPIDLVQGDLADLKFSDGAFDTVMSLNVMVHFPHWREVLREWKRLVRPGGRIVFDIHSLDHEDAACQRRGEKARRDSDMDVGAYVARLRVAELVETASRLGLSIAAVVPYAGLCNENFWLKGTAADSERFQRLLSWIVEDRRLYAFALFVEQEVFARLTSQATFRMMIVLDNREGAVENQAWLARNDALNRTLASGALRFDALSQAVPACDGAWRARLDGHMDWLRNRVLAFFLLLAFAPFRDPSALESFIAPGHASTLADWLGKHGTDRLVSAMLLDFTRIPEVGRILSHRDVPLVGALEYELTQDLLDRYFQAFGKESN